MPNDKLTCWNVIVPASVAIDQKIKDVIKTLERWPDDEFWTNTLAEAKLAAEFIDWVSTNRRNVVQEFLDQRK